MTQKKTTLFDQKTSLNTSISPTPLYVDGLMKENSNLSKHSEEKIDTISTRLLLLEARQLENQSQMKEKTYAIAESRRRLKKTTLCDKLNFSEVNSLITLSSQTLDQVLTSKEKVFNPFWTTQSKEISSKLWLPTKTDYVDSVLKSSRESFLPTKGASWFSIKEQLPLKKNLLMTSSQSSQFSLPVCTVSGPIQLRKNSKTPSSPKKPVRTLKGRLLPTETEKQQLKTMMEQSRWYYNALVSCVKALFPKEKILVREKFTDYQIRDILTNFIYTEEISQDYIIQSFIQKKTPDTTQFCPPWWSNIHTRLPRGVAKKMTQNLNSIITNFKNGNITKFELKYKSRKHSNTEFVMFEDAGFPAFIRGIKSQYWYTDGNGKKQRSSLSELIKQTKPRGIEITYDKRTDKYFFSYPVDYDFFPVGDRRNENQVSSECGERIITIDPGVRKFGVGYDPSGKIVVFGEGANKELIRLMLLIDKEKNNEIKKYYWKRIHDLTEELHWKVISYLMKNYDLIMIPEFRISGMVKGHKISRQTKRLLYIFRYYSFLQKLKYKTQTHNKKLYVVDEVYTSKTCTNCGCLKTNLGSKEMYECDSCGMKIDRDVNGSRNIYIKNIQVR